MTLAVDKTSFINNIGQIIEPGDPIVIVTQGYNKRIVTRRGTFRGMRKGKCVVSYIQTETGYFTMDGEQVSTATYYKLWEQRAKFVSKRIEVLCQRTLQLNRIFKIAI